MALSDACRPRFILPSRSLSLCVLTRRLFSTCICSLRPHSAKVESITELQGIHRGECTVRIGSVAIKIITLGGSERLWNSLRAKYCRTSMLKSVSQKSFTCKGGATWPVQIICHKHSPPRFHGFTDALWAKSVCASAGAPYIGSDIYADRYIWVT